MIPWRLRRLLPFRRYRDPAPVVGVVRLNGVIGRMGPLQRGLTLASVAGPLERAFKMPEVKAVALALNSPGGSPVQSALIARRIRTLAEEHDVPVVAFAEDVAASGGYWLATAADEIFADASSIIGSIGVISAGFGFSELMKRVGVERRLHATGEGKGAMDPFQRERAEDVEHLKEIQADIHEAFCAQVRERRGDRLKGAEEDVFGGRFWTGTRALEKGLIDGIGDLRTVMRDRYGERVQLRLIGDGRPWWRRRLRLPSIGSAAPSPADWAAGAIAAVEERLTWNRFGL